MAISDLLVTKLLKEFPLNLHGLHGIGHWARVNSNGQMLAKLYSLNPEILALFSIFHDCRRIDDFSDKNHGLNGADYAKLLRGEFFELRDNDFQVLYKACKYHSLQINCSNKTIQACWDSDRLDIGRCKVLLNLDYIATHCFENDCHYKMAYQRGFNHEKNPEYFKWAKLLENE
jgi:uncharacterized protein